MTLWPMRLSRRGVLWALLVMLVVAMLATLVWLAGRYEVSQLQARIERDAADAVSDIRTAMKRNVQSLQALHYGDVRPPGWQREATQLLREHREWIRLEWRDLDLRVIASVDSPYRAPAFGRSGIPSRMPDVMQACTVARRQSGPGYSASNFYPLADGLGIEVMELCLPLMHNGEVTGYAIASYALSEILGSMVGPGLLRSRELSFTEADGTRLAVSGVAARKGSRVFVAQQLLELPGHALVLRIDSWRAAPDVFPNVLTALVTGMTIALVTVLAMLARDTRRRLRAESHLADALAFRKAMEDSLVTGLRARDTEGRITYVNPAFCEMVGFEAQELLGHSMPAPYWPPEMIDEYGKRQALRLAGNAPPREGVESVFMRKNGERFPVLIFEAPLINANGTQTGWMGAILDISEQRRVEELSRTSQERLQATARLATVGEMASLLSHELNQPLAAISSYATGSRNLIDDAHLPPELTSHLSQAIGRIAQQAERAGKVIKSVHDFVRRRDQARESVAPRTLIDNVMPLVVLQARKLGVRVQLDCPSDLPTVWCDRTMVEQILLNLARNGMQAMADQTHDKVLVLSVREAASNATSRWLAFRVVDHGPGISDDVAQQLFTPFFTTKAEGMGLGLSLCRTVVEQHGGYLGHEPHQPRGTVFHFTLPQAPAASLNG
jgi:two-component system sensor histidine kinase DctS